jgi:hypothetical protein
MLGNRPFLGPVPLSFSPSLFSLSGRGRSPFLGAVETEIGKVPPVDVPSELARRLCELARQYEARPNSEALRAFVTYIAGLRRDAVGRGAAAAIALKGCGISEEVRRVFVTAAFASAD